MYIDPNQLNLAEPATSPQFERRSAAPSSEARSLRPGQWEDHHELNLEIPLHWSVPWSDLMMVMMVMFAVLFVTKPSEQNSRELHNKTNSNSIVKASPNHQEKSIDKSPDASIPAEEILRLSEKLVTEANLDNIDVVLTENQAVKVSVRGNLLFDSGSAELKEDAIQFLNKLAGVIASNNYMIEVSGHTDDFPIKTTTYPTNWELSSARASRVARYLIEAGNLNPGRFTVSGHAFYRPVAKSIDSTNKAQNRRVEILITRNEYKP